MRKLVWTIAFTLVCVASTVHAKKRSIGEDPFAYDEREAAREQERQEVKARRTFSNAGDFVVSVERLVGYAHTTRTIKQGPDDTVDIDRVHGLTNLGADLIGYSSPRIAFDVFAATGFSLGACVGYSQNSGDQKTKLILLSPRLGYAAMFGDAVGLWPRLGATYQELGAATGDAWLLAGTLDVPLVLVAGSHALITLGPRLDWSFAGQYLPDAGGNDKLKAREYGFSAGLSLFF